MGPGAKAFHSIYSFYNTVRPKMGSFSGPDNITKIYIKLPLKMLTYK